MRAEVTIPVYNEEKDLPKCIDRLTRFLADQKLFESSVVIADNASTDRTWELAQELEKQYSNVKALHIPQKGRGLALRTVWSQSRADIVSYMDVDLSTDIKYYPLMVYGLSVGYDIAIGSRLMGASRVTRLAKREFLSRGYNVLIHSMFWPGFSDAQCGFKALRREVAQRLLPHVKNNNWFFDCETLLLAERNHLRIFEVPVEWTEDPDSRAKIIGSVIEHSSGLLRMRFSGYGLKI
ncbi:MAG TPA: dolichyl-phosphate beta-glucosyltransferase [Verrucomicrobiae bacterium]|nr:dolichyl-phosphate beta-glucosyltransferase [Verrucomicrobiae bacterium]